MPCISVDKIRLFEELEIGMDCTHEQFSDLCFSYGLELDDVVREDNKVVFKIEIPANRCELLCFEGLTLFLKTFLKSAPLPKCKIIPTEIKLIIKEEVKNIRPYCVAACLFNLNLTQEIFDSLIDFQEKLHLNICRKRTLVSIGIHDMDKIKHPFTYTAMNPLDIKFQALTLDEELDSFKILEIFKNNKNLKNYVSIIDKFDKYPIVLDSNNIVMSLPPVINGNVSKLSLDTKNIFIEVTATDRVKANVVLNSLVFCFSKYCANPYEIGSVDIISKDEIITSPEFKIEKFDVANSWLNKMMGVDINIDDMCKNLSKMGLETEHTSNDNISVYVPSIRSDIIHPFDIFEDAAIGYGFNNIQKIVPVIVSKSSLLLLSRFTDMIRLEMLNLGYIEVLSFILGFFSDMTEKLNYKDLNDNCLPVKIDTQHDINCVRNSLVPGMLKTVAANRKSPLPIKIFEVSDVVIKDENSPNGARNQKNLCVIYCGTTSGFELVHGVLDRIMSSMNIPARFINKEKTFYYIKNSKHPMFLPHRCFEIHINDNSLGFMGIVNPEVWKNFDVNQAVCTTMELNMEKLLQHYND